MDAEEVQRLAEQENAMRAAHPDTCSPSTAAPAASPPLSPEELRAALESGKGEWVAYTPLGSTPGEGTEPEPPEASDNIGGFHAVAVGTVLVVRFRWLPDPQPHDYLLHLNCTNQAPGDLDGVSVLLLERLHHLAHRWHDRETVPLSEHVSLVQLPDTPH